MYLAPQCPSSFTLTIIMDDKIMTTEVDGEQSTAQGTTPEGLASGKH